MLKAFSEKNGKKTIKKIQELLMSLLFSYY